MLEAVNHNVSSGAVELLLEGPSSNLEHLGSGLDSSVYRCGDQVFHVYGPHIDISKLSLYQRVTNEAREQLKHKPFQWYGEENWEWQIGDVTTVGGPIKDSAGDEHCYSICRFYPGANLLDLYLGASRRLTNKQPKRIFDEIGGMCETQRMIWGFSKHMSQLVNCRGIALDIVNIIPYADGPKRMFVVTDLCRRLGDLEVNTW